MPLSDGYWAVENLLTRSISEPMHNKAPKEMRGLVNELAFIAFCSAIAVSRTLTRDAIRNAITDAIPSAVGYINRVSSAEPVTVQDVDETCIRESAQLVLRLLSFCPTGTSVKIRPKFSGCGMIAACEGDLIVGDCLYEIKAGDRPFRISDLRQLLTYSALAFASGNLTFNRLGLFNPRTGKVWVRSIDHVCHAVSGQRANDVLSRVVEHMGDVPLPVEPSRAAAPHS